MDNLLELLGEQVSPEIISQAAGLVGESEASTQSAVTAMLPTLMGAMANKGSTEAGAADLLKMMTDQGDTSEMLGNFAGMLGNPDASKGLMDSGGSMLSGLLGDNMGSVIGLLSQFTGMGQGSSSSLMGILMPLIMGTVGKKVLGDGMGAQALMGLLGGQKDFINAAMPAGLDLSSVTGLMSGAANLDMPDVNLPGVSMPDVDVPNVDAPKVEMPNVSAPDVSVPEVNASGGMPGWLLPLIGLLVVLGLLWWLFGRGGAPDVSVPDAPSLDASITGPACDGIGSITGAIDGIGEINADTDAGVVSGAIATARGALDQVAGLAGIAEVAGFAQIGDAIGTVEGLLDGVEGALGEKAEEVSTAVGSITDSVGGVTGALGCE